MRRISKHFEKRRKVVNGWEIGRLIGSGAWAEVRLAIKVSPNGTIQGNSSLQSAVKIIRKKDLIKNEGRSPASEIEILKRLCHPNTIKLLEVCFFKNIIYNYFYLFYFTTKKKKKTSQVSYEQPKSLQLLLIYFSNSPDL